MLLRWLGVCTLYGEVGDVGGVERKGLCVYGVKCSREEGRMCTRK